MSNTPKNIIQRSGKNVIIKKKKKMCFIGTLYNTLQRSEMPFETQIKICNVKRKVNHCVDNIINAGVTMTKPGALKYLLWGSQPSEHSVSIKFGKVGEVMFQELIKASPHMELLKCGVQIINDKGKKKDIDLIWKDKQKKIIYFRECKGNFEMDSEKLPATFAKVKHDIAPFLGNEYPDYKIDCGILNWSVYSREIVKKTVSHIKNCEKNGIKVDHVKDFLKNINFEWSEENYYTYFKSIGKKINQMF